MTMAAPTPQALKQQVYATLGDYLRRDPADLHPDDSLRDDLGLDSLQTIELVYQVESAFDIQIPDEDFGRLQTIGNVTTYLGERIGVANNRASPNTTSTKTKKPSIKVTKKPKSQAASKVSPK